MSNKLKQDLSIGQNLKALRKKANLTQRDASAQLELLGVPMTEDILAKMEQGKYSVRISEFIPLTLSSKGCVFPPSPRKAAPSLFTREGAVRGSIPAFFTKTPRTYPS